MNKPPFKMTMFNSTNASIVAFILGFISIVFSLYIGNRLFRTSLHNFEKQYREFYLREAKFLVHTAENIKNDEMNVLLDEIQMKWEAIGPKYADEYICIVDEKANLIMHTAHPETIGNYAGENLIANTIETPETCLGDLVKTGRDYVGDYISSSGQHQLAAFISVPGKGWVVGVHRSKKALMDNIEEGMRFSRIGFYLVCGLLMPVSWILIYLTFYMVERKRKRAEQELFEQRNFLQRAQEIGKIGSWDLNIETNELLWTDENYKIFGLPIGTPLTYETFLNCVLEDDREFVNKAWKASYTGEPYDIEHRMLVDGKMKWVREKAELEFNQRGECVRGTGVTQDITDRKMAEIRLAEAKELFELVFHSQLDAILIISPEGNGTILECNDAATKIFGYDADELIGAKTKKLHIDNEHAKLFQTTLLTDIKSKGSLKNFRFRLKRENGNIFPSEHTVLEMKNGAQDRIGWISIIRDLSEMQATKDALFESENKFRLLYDNAPLSYQSLDENGNFVEVNDTWLNQLGYEKNEVIGRNFSEFIASEWQKHFQVNFPRFKAIGEVLGVEFEMVKKDGSHILVAFHGKIGKKSDGTFKQTHCIFTDITKQRSFEEERDLLEQKMIQMQRMESIGNLAGGIAHDFNNILFPIIGMSEMLMEDFRPGSPEFENVQEIYLAGKRGSDLVKQILSFSRQHEHKFIPVSVQKIIKEVARLSRSTIPANIEIRETIEKRGGLVMADPTQLHQVVLNLITNAYHAIEDINGVIDIKFEEISLEGGKQYDYSMPAGRYVVISVSDNGSGMTPQVQNRIFEPYFTTKERGKGTGLGLAVVYGIIKEHAGDIKVNSEEGKGSTFEVYLPLMEKNKESVTIENLEDIQGGNERILLIDDEESILRLEQKILERLGYQVTIRSNSTETLDEFASDPNAFDLVITDMAMPGMTGDQLAENLISIRADIPVIICTGFSDRIDKEKAAAIGIKDFLLKPVLKRELAKKVRSVLDLVKG